jgi:preprotein translocase subunit SecE
MTKEDYINMNTFIVILVMVAFLAAIFASGYNDKPGSTK